jgi:hypothetical protein
MKLVKTRLRNKINDDFLDDNLVVNIEKEIVMDFITDMIVDEFYSIKNHRGLLSLEFFCLFISFIFMSILNTFIL